MLTCELCHETIEADDEEIRRDESGDYHLECLEKYWVKEVGYILADRAQLLADPDPDGAYDWGDPKHGGYMDSIHDRLDIQGSK